MELSEFFIGTVYGINKLTRELDVYIPKLMPAIPETREEMTVPTNMSGKELQTQYSNNLKYLSKITVAAEDADTEMPKVGSKVRVRFLDNSIQRGFWSKWNPNGDYEIIDEEKYPTQSYLMINDRKIGINLLDTIQLILPEGYSYVVNEKDKTKKITLIKDTVNDERISLLESMVGRPRQEREYDDEFGHHKELAVETGLYSKISELEAKVSELKEKLSKLEGN